MTANAVITGWGMYAPLRVMTNDELSTMVDTSDEWIVSPHRHPRTSHRRRRRDDHHPVRQCRAGRAGRRRRRRLGGRPGDRGDLLARLPAARHRGAGGHRAGRHPRRRLRPAGRLLRLPLRAGDRRQLHPQRHVPPGAGDRGGGAQPLPRLDRSQHLRPVRRRRGRGPALGLRPARRAARLRAVQRWRRLRGDHRAGRRQRAPGVGRDGGRSAAHHPHAGQRGLQVRHPADGRLGRGRPAQGRPRRWTTSTSSSSTRPTCGSSRASRSSSTSPRRRSSSTSRSTATRPPPPCRWPWRRRSPPAASSRATGS